jgi:hypothetical protein
MLLDITYILYAMLSKIYVGLYFCLQGEQGLCVNVNIERNFEGAEGVLTL